MKKTALKLYWSADIQLKEKIKDWYNGYFFSRWIIYDPWSITNCLKRYDPQHLEKNIIQPYWVNSENISLIIKIFERICNHSQIRLLLDEGRFEIDDKLQIVLTVYINCFAIFHPLNFWTGPGS